jgi:hypothetical protein
MRISGSADGPLPVRVNRREDGLRPGPCGPPQRGLGQTGRNVNVLIRDLVSVVGNGAPYFEARVRVRPV